MENMRDAAWLMERVDVQKNGCWVWRLAKKEKGYGVFTENRNQKLVYVHRFSYELFKGPIPHGMFVCHKCDNPPCCNPDHLFTGTNSDNMRDCVQKGRHIVPLRDLGIKLTWQVLTDEQIAEIKMLINKGLRNEEIARAYGISGSTIQDIRTGRTHSKIGPSITKRQQPIKHGKKLVESDVLAIRAKYAQGDITYAELATQYSVNSTNIGAIIRREVWQHV